MELYSKHHSLEGVGILSKPSHQLKDGGKLRGFFALWSVS